MTKRNWVVIAFACFALTIFATLYTLHRMKKSEKIERQQEQDVTSAIINLAKRYDLHKTGPYQYAVTDLETGKFPFGSFCYHWARQRVVTGIAFSSEDLGDQTEIERAKAYEEYAGLMYLQALESYHPADHACISDKLTALTIGMQVLQRITPPNKPNHHRKYKTGLQTDMMNVIIKKGGLLNESRSGSAAAQNRLREIAGLFDFDENQLKAAGFTAEEISKIKQ